MNKNICKNCANAHPRSPFSFKQYGAYYCGYECSLKENEKQPYKRLDDTCEKWEKKASG